MPVGERIGIVEVHCAKHVFYAYQNCIDVGTHIQWFGRQSDCFDLDHRHHSCCHSAQSLATVKASLFIT